jgi:hypothetical protein
MHAYAQARWEERCGGFGYHEASCLGEWWNDWGDETLLVGAAAVAGVCIASTAGTAAPACVYGGAALTGVNVVDSATNNNLLPGGKPPDWGNFAVDVTIEAFGFGGGAGLEAAFGKRLKSYGVRLMTQVPRLISAATSYLRANAGKD